MLLNIVNSLIPKAHIYHCPPLSGRIWFLCLGQKEFRVRHTRNRGPAKAQSQARPGPQLGVQWKQTSTRVRTIRLRACQLKSVLKGPSEGRTKIKAELSEPSQATKNCRAPAQRNEQLWPLTRRRAMSEEELSAWVGNQVTSVDPTLDAASLVSTGLKPSPPATLTEATGSPRREKCEIQRR